MKVKKSRFIKAWQLFVLFGCLAAVLTMLEYGADLTKRNYQALSDQTQQLSRMAVRLAAETAAPNIVEKNQEQLQQLVEQLTDEPLILDATLYELEGATIARSQNALPLEMITGLSTPLSIASQGRQQLVEPVMTEHQVVGFLRITLEHDKLLAATISRIDYVTNVIRAMIISALMIGFLLAFTFGRRKDIWHFPFLLTANTKD
ncbi:SerB-cotransposed membrane protein precursor [Photobacterium aquae]|uniref:SerB-cotransposed membrane protein n=1 Tax=Photobacterium aquae TaxID=1195763 RepID=A0A0J1GXS6_9GAMM|nr:AhpA/YtjB family protein [Photobacterium aquae]KLV04465.1 SerB-cotransposed membrane protein precursor [Photobacterium aquae]